MILICLLNVAYYDSLLKVDYQRYLAKGRLPKVDYQRLITEEDYLI